MRGGALAALPYDRRRGCATHTALAVYSEMLLQICRLYPGLPDPRALTVREIVFFYNGLRGALEAITKSSV